MKVIMNLMNGGRANGPIVSKNMLDHRKPWKLVLHAIASKDMGKGSPYSTPKLLMTEKKDGE